MRLDILHETEAEHLLAAAQKETASAHYTFQLIAT